MNTTQCLVALHQYCQEQEGRAHIFAKNIHPWQFCKRISTPGNFAKECPPLAMGEGAYWRLGPPSTLNPLPVTLLLCPPILLVNPSSDQNALGTLFSPPFSMPLFSGALHTAQKLKFQLFSASLLCDNCTRWLHTLALWQCEWPIVPGRVQQKISATKNLLKGNVFDQQRDGDP